MIKSAFFVENSKNSDRPHPKWEGTGRPPRGSGQSTAPLVLMSE